MHFAMLSGWTTSSLVLAFLVGTVVIAVTGTRMAALADRLADRTGLGEAMTGALFLGVTTSLPGITASVTAALDGRPALAVSNALGGIAVQTAFLAVADIFHRRANLEHAAASLTNLIHTTVLVVLLAIVGLATVSPEAVDLGHVGLATPVLVAAYVLGLHTAFAGRKRPMWQPRVTAETVLDEPEPENRRRSLVGLWTAFGISALFVIASGALVARSAGELVGHLGVSESVMGALFVAISTSLPELATTIAAVRRGALTLAVSDIAGGNAFDVLFICVADVVYLEGSIYRAVGGEQAFLAALGVLLNGLLLLGLLRRQRSGPGNIGFESLLILAVYFAGFIVLASTF